MNDPNTGPGPGPRPAVGFGWDAVGLTCRAVQDWGGAGEDRLSGVQVGGVEVGKLDPGDLAQLLLAELGDRGVRAWAAPPLGRPAALASSAEAGGVRSVIGMIINPLLRPSLVA